MYNQYARTEMLFGKESMERLWKSKVAVFGIGGVGGHVVEALARAGIGHLVLIDNDSVSVTNLNRQLIALHSTIGKDKTEVMKERIRDINPDIEVEVRNCFYLPEQSANFAFEDYDYVVDAIDTVTAKIDLAVQCQRTNTPIIASMGTGNKLNPTMLEVTDIYKTSVCPLAKVLRKELKQRDIKKLKVVYSKEIPLKPLNNGDLDENAGKRSVPGSVSFVPSVAGLIIAGEVIKDLVKDCLYKIQW